ncbi:hypothetical protein [Pseudoalteromonas fuliginea]|uniref:hypothetical protein n=1 Tax=Pseudoalteromonas fuliginea TaxID=1872678 RepID=UPI00317DDB46
MDLEKINKFSWVLTDLIVDLGTTSMFYHECYKSSDFNPDDNEYHLGKLRMCHLNAIMALSKLVEVLEGYANELKACCSAELVTKTWKYKKLIEDKKIYAFRSTYVAHVFDQNTKSPLNLSSAQTKFTNIVGNTLDDVQSFYDWISSVLEPKDDLLTHLVTINGNLASYLNGNELYSKRT